MLESRPKGRRYESHRRHCVVSLSKNINPSLVLVQPRETRPYITERLLMGRKESNQSNKTRKCHIHRTQTIPREPEEETLNNNSHVTGRTQNNQLQCISYSSRAWSHTFFEIDHEMFSTVILLLLLIQEGVNIVSCKPLTVIEKETYSKLDRL